MRTRLILLITSIYLSFQANTFAQIYSSDLCDPISANCTSSSYWSGSYTAYYAFDNYQTSGNCWASNAVPTTSATQWVKYDFGTSPKIIIKYTVTARYYTSDQGRCPKDWTFEGSNDNTTWDVLDTRTEETGWNTNSSPTTKREYFLSNSTAYRYYRINITANNGGTSYVAIGEMEMMSEAVPTDYVSKRSNIWYFGNYAGLNFNTEPVSVLTDGAMVAREGCSSICDTAGNLLFYTNGAKVWNKTHVLMDNGDSLMVIVSSANPPHPTQAGVIIPNPGNSNQYYIFTVPCMWTSPSYDMYFRYALVDMSLNGGLGKVIQKDVRIGNYNATERITAVAHQNQHDIWVINREDNTNRFRSYLIKNNGIDTNNVVISEQGATSSGNCNMGCLKASPDGKKLAMAFWCDGAASHYELYDFNNATGEISNLNDLGYPTGASRYCAYGVEFSPDGSRLYGTTHMDMKIHQWNMQAGDNTAIKNSRVQIGTTSNYVGALQVAPNGKIYAALSIDGNTGYHTIGVINNPNVLGTGCSYVNNGIRVDANYTNTNLSRQGFPNFIQSFLYAPPFNFANVCFGDSTEFTISSTTNISTVTWNFDDPASGINNTSADFSPTHVFSDTGTYNVQLVVVFTNATVDTSTQEVTIFGAPSVSLGSDTSLCMTTPYVIDAGNPGSTYEWNDASTNQTLSVSSPGTYSVTVTNAYGCQSTDDIIINIAPDITVNLGNDTTICEGTALVLDAGNAGATYEWSDASTNQTLSVNSAGTYSITVTNNGCSGTGLIQIGINPLPQAVITPGGTISICSGSSQQLVASGGDSYLWSTSETTASIVVTPSSDATFYVTATNSCGTHVESVEVLLNGGTANITASLDSVCQGQTTDLTATGGTSFLWSTGETTQTITVSPLSDTQYYVTVSGSGCSDSTSIFIAVKPAIVAVANPAEVCAGNTVILTVSPGETYLWSTGETTQSINVNPGITTTYHVTVTSGVCSDSVAVPVTIHDNPVVSLGANTSICPGNSISLDAQNPGATYLWSDGTATQTNIINAAGTYSVTVTNSFSCTSSGTINIGLFNLPVVSLGNDTVLCSGSQITLDAGNSGSTYLWSESSTNQTLLVNNPGTYSVTVTDANNCENSDEIIITAGIAPVVDLGNDTSFCSGNSVQLNAGNPGFSYNWSTGSQNQTITVSSAGNYSVTVTSSDNCTDRDTLTVSINPLPVVNLGNDTILCSGNTLLLDAGNSGSTYNWSAGGTLQTLLVNSTGTYSVTVTSADNCSTSKNIDVSIRDLPDFSLSDTSFCENDSVMLDAGIAGMSYLWSNGESTQQITIYNSGGYIVTVTDAYGCLSSDTSTVNVNLLPYVNLIDNPSTCDSIQFDAENAGATYIWSTGATTQTIYASSATNYSVTVTDVNGCSSSDMTTLSILSPPQADIGDNQSVCEGGTATFSTQQQSGYQYLWSNGSTTSSITVSTNGTYSVTVQNICGTATDNATLTVNNLPDVNLGDDMNIYADSTVSLDAGISNATYLWSTGETTQTITVTPPVTVQFIVTVTDDNGCTSSDTIIVTVTEKPVTSLIIYNTLTLNNDGINDYWHIENIEQYPENHIEIYNRNGNKIYEKDGYTNEYGWDGKYNGNYVPASTYYYIIDIGNDSEILRGYITIIK